MPIRHPRPTAWHTTTCASGADSGAMAGKCLHNHGPRPHARSRRATPAGGRHSGHGASSADATHITPHHEESAWLTALTARKAQKAQAAPHFPRKTRLECHKIRIFAVCAGAASHPHATPGAAAPATGGHSQPKTSAPPWLPWPCSRQRTGSADGPQCTPHTIRTPHRAARGQAVLTSHTAAS